MTMADELQKLQALREQGVLTEEEFNRAKQRVLNECSGEAGAAREEPAQSASQPNTLQHKLHRSVNDSWIGGVCGGLAEVTQVPSWAWRIFFVLATFLHLFGVAAYLLLWIFVPMQKVMVVR